MNWTAEPIALLTKLWNEGLSASQIARSLSDTFEIYFSRNSVIGKRMRLGLAARQRDTSQPVKRRARQPGKTLANSRFFHGGTMSFPILSASPAPAPPRPEPQEKPLALLLVDLQDKQCRWPLDTESEGIRDRWLFCGLPKMDSRDPSCRYCFSHWKRSLSEEGLRREMAKRRKAA